MKAKILSILLMFAGTSAIAQINFNTGSKELDADLNSINVSAKADLTVFKTDLSVEFNVSTKEVNNLFSLKMEPGEVYLTLEISKISKKSSIDVATCYKSNKSKGWGYIAKEMGIKPGSAEFHELKGSSKNKKSKGNKGNSKGNSKGNGKGNSKKK